MCNPTWVTEVIYLDAITKVLSTLKDESYLVVAHCLVVVVVFLFSVALEQIKEREGKRLGTDVCIIY